jgi:hypothetical protein
MTQIRPRAREGRGLAVLETDRIAGVLETHAVINLIG